MSDILMSQSENDELNELLFNSPSNPAMSRNDCVPEHPGTLRREPQYGNTFIQWTCPRPNVFIPSGITKDILEPGLYEIEYSESSGYYFNQVQTKTEGIINFPHSNSDTILKEIQNFWELKSEFIKFDLAYKRGILLWGPPGSGKSCILQLICKDVIERHGLVIKFEHPRYFVEGYRLLREIQPSTPVVSIIEDIDAIIQNSSEAEVINILDGSDKFENIVFLATTNYPERLGARIINRPSRFDKRFKIDVPSEESRKIYFEHLIKDHPEINIDISKWVQDTSGFSIAHLKELFIAVIILKNDYAEALNTLRTMKIFVNSDHDELEMGFRRKNPF